MTSDTFLPVLGGGEIHVKNIMEQFTSRGLDVELVTTEGRPSEYDKDHHVVRIGWKRSNLFKLFAAVWRGSKGAVAIHVHYSYRLGVIAGIVGRLRNIPVFVILHGLGTLDEPGAKFRYRMAHAFYRRMSLLLSTFIISTSQDIAEAAYPYTRKDKVTVIMNGYDDKLFNEHVAIPSEITEKYKDKQVILTVRRLVPKNGIHFLVEAMPYILKKVPNAHYVMIGDGRMRGDIEARIKRLGIGAHIDMLGVTDNQNIPPYLKRAGVVVFPSTAESSSIACSEAMAVGKFIVASDVGGLPELVGRDGSRGALVKLVDWTGSNYDAPMTLPEARYEALAEAIADVLKSGSPEREHSIATYAKAELSWDVIATKTLAVYARFIPDITT